MSKEVNIVAAEQDKWRGALDALPDPGIGKKLIVFVSASSVRLRIVDDTSTIGEQETESGEGGSVKPS